MLRDKWFLAGLVIVMVAGGTAFIVGSAIRTSWEQTGGSAVPPTQPVVTPAPAGKATPRTAAPAGPPRSPSAAQATAAIVRRHPAWRKIEAGRFREAQEDFLELLLINPGEQEAMSGLVTARRRLAGDDPSVLRRQATAYQQAVVRKTETDEHYTIEAMVLLAQANLLGAAEIEAERGRSQPPAAAVTPRPAPTVTPGAIQPLLAPTRRSAAPSPSPRVIRPPVPAAAATSPGGRVRRTPAPPLAAVTPTSALPTPGALPAPPAPRETTGEAPVDANEPFVVVRIGPLADSSRVSEIVGELTLAGYSAGVRRREEPLAFHVMSEPLARGAAERRAQVLASYGFRSRLIVQTGGLAQLEFGVFQSQEVAEALASRIRTRGYHATVVREGGTGYMITAGPYRQSVASAIVRLIRGKFGGDLGMSVGAP